MCREISTRSRIHFLIMESGTINEGREDFVRLAGKRSRIIQTLIIVVGPSLSLHRCGLPREIAIELFRTFVIRGVAKSKIREKSRQYGKSFKKLCRTPSVLSNRAPTLHRLGIRHSPAFSGGRAICLHPLVCKDSMPILMEIKCGPLTYVFSYESFVSRYWGSHFRTQRKICLLTLCINEWKSSRYLLARGLLDQRCIASRETPIEVHYESLGTFYEIYGHYLIVRSLKNPFIYIQPCWSYCSLSRNRRSYTGSYNVFLGSSRKCVSMAVISIFLSYSVIPFGDHLVLADLSIGVFFWIAISSIAPVGLLMSGYGSNNKYSFLGGLRAAAQSISYEIPLALCVLSISLLDIVEAQSKYGFWGWNLWRQPIGKEELVAWYQTEYSVLYLGGWNLSIPYIFVPELFGINKGGKVFGTLIGIFITLAKTYLFLFIPIATRWTLPVRMDQLLNLGWKFLLPISLGNLLLTTSSQLLSL
ncbi:hypothetical protein H5410_056297 [Solanum commersonii]|uniref:NADH-plastoquinone oxidoreductase subunit 1 n=1 Tax=Solanum commersonii TaxID=4109 RepID=A0A9J5WJW7_SOLCO|nr:hypothetical protein H5410_056297 [Solanum commersonii]